MSRIHACPKTEGIRPQAEGKPLRGIQHRSSGSGLVIRVVCLVGLPGGPTIFLLYSYSGLRPIPRPLMALSRDQKEAQLQELLDKMKRSSSIMFSHYIGLSVSQASDLRAKLKDSQAEMKVAKKTLMLRAAKELNMELNEDVLEGPVACIFSYEEPMAGAQVAHAFAKQNPKVELIGGMFEGTVLSKEQALAFATMPTRTQLIGMFAGMIQSPLRNFASMCRSPLSAFARALDEVAKQKATA